MIVDLKARYSDLPFVDAVYHARSVGGGSFISNATTQWEMVVTRQQEKITLSLRGPETQASPAPIPEDAEFLGIIFKHGTFMPSLPGYKLVDEEIHLSATGRNTFHLFGETWQFPTFENTDTFAGRLMRKELVVHDQLVADVLRGKSYDLSLRSIQRRFLHVTGLTYKAIQQVERARKAVELLQSGFTILDATHQAGYFDQAHLTNSLRRYYGQTPAQILQSGNST